MQKTIQKLLATLFPPRMTIKVAQEFSRHPFGRYEKDGDYNGEKFRILLKERFAQGLKEGKILIVRMDDVEGLGASFMDEGLGKFAGDMLAEHDVEITPRNLKLKGNHPAYELYFMLMREHMEKRKAQARRQQDARQLRLQL